MDVYVTEAPAGSPPHLLAGRFAPLNGTFPLLVGPAEEQRTKRTRKSISIPFFHALGKNLALAGSYTSQTSEFRSYLADWFAAYQARELVVFNAKVLYPGTMAAIFEYASTVPRITFAADAGDLAVTREAVVASGLTPALLDWENLLQRLPIVNEPSGSLSDCRYGPEHLPVTDFVLFRATARALNTTERFEAIDADYKKAYAEASRVQTDLDSVIAMMGTLAWDAENTAQIAVTLRATQAALLRRGWLLDAHQDKAIGTLSAMKPPAPTEADWLALHGYVPTRRPATAALYLLDVPRHDLPAITVAEVQTWLNTHQVGNIPLPPLAAPLLRAHLHRRTSQGAGPADPYLAHQSTTGLAEDLVLVRRHLNLPIDGRALKREASHTTRPLWRLGLELRSLT